MDGWSDEKLVEDYRVGLELMVYLRMHESGRIWDGRVIDEELDEIFRDMIPHFKAMLAGVRDEIDARGLVV